jgi:putative membrane protein
MTDEEPGRAVDVRFALANERTLLAWVRTALALLAAGGAVGQLTDLPARKTLAVLLAVGGIAAAGAGGWRYQRTAAALRRGDGPIAGIAPVALAGAVAIAGLVLVIAVATR